MKVISLNFLSIGHRKMDTIEQTYQSSLVIFITILRNLIPLLTQSLYPHKVRVFSSRAHILSLKQSLIFFYIKTFFFFSISTNCRPVFIREFGAWVERSSSDSYFRFGEEFEVGSCLSMIHFIYIENQRIMVFSCISLKFV